MSKKKQYFLVSLSFFFGLLFTLQASGAQLTDNEYNDYDPVVSGFNIAWMGSDGNDEEIYLYNGSSVLQLSNNTYFDCHVRISGNYVVWQSYDGFDYEIFLYNGSKVIQLTGNAVDDTFPDIWESNIIWLQQLGTQVEVMLFDGTSIRALTNTPQQERAPKISGSNHTIYAAWTSEDSTGSRVFFYEGKNHTVLQLGHYLLPVFSPSISGARVVWSAYDPAIGGWDIFVYDRRKVRNLTRDRRADVDPVVSGRHIAWRSFDGEDYEIYLFNGRSVRRLTNNAINDGQVRISDANVVWRSRGDIYLYTPKGVRNITSTAWEETFVDISGGNIVWDSRPIGEEDWEIFSLTID